MTTSTGVDFPASGVYVTEDDLSHVAQGIALDTACFQGVAEKGPVNELRDVFSLDEYFAVFGGYVPGHYLTYAVAHFYKNGGRRLRINRIVHYTNITNPGTIATAAAAATATVNDRKAGGAQAKCRFDCAWLGTSGTRARVRVYADDRDGASEFSLAVYYDAVLMEVHNHLNMDPDSPDYAVTRLADDGVSRNVRFVDLHDYDGADAALPLAERRPVVTSAGGAVPVNTVGLAGGNDGLAGLAASDWIGSAATDTGVEGAVAKGAEDLDFLAMPGFVDGDAYNDVIGFVEEHQYCVALFDPPDNLRPSEAADFRYARGAYEGTFTQFNSNRACLAYPWVRDADPLTNSEIALPPTGVLAGVIMRTLATNPVWKAAAGLKRGRVFGVKGVKYAANRTERGVLEQAGIIPLVNFNGGPKSFEQGGMMVYGVRNLQVVYSDMNTLPARMTINFVARSIGVALQDVVFEPHNAATYRSVVRIGQPLLDAMVGDGTNGGLSFGKMFCDATTNTAQDRQAKVIKAKAIVQLTPTAEKIAFNITITPQTVTVEEIDAFLAAA